MPGSPLMAMLTNITATRPISANQPLSSASHTYRMGGGIKRLITLSKNSCFLISCWSRTRTATGDGHVLGAAECRLHDRTLSTWDSGLINSSRGCCYAKCSRTIRRTYTDAPALACAALVINSLKRRFSVIVSGVEKCKETVALFLEGTSFTLCLIALQGVARSQSRSCLKLIRQTNDAGYLSRYPIHSDERGYGVTRSSPLLFDVFVATKINLDSPP